MAQTGPAKTGPVRPAAQLVSIILARPLFSPGRRPRSDEAVAAAPASELPRLTGTVITLSGRTALFAVPGADKPIAAREGDNVGRFVVGAIGPTEVAMTGPDGPALWRMRSGPQAVMETAAPVPTEQALHTRGNEDQHAE